MIRTIEWTDSGVVMLDQRRLPTEEIYNCYTEYTEVADAIRTMVIRGAPAIGVAAAMGVALGVRNAPAVSIAELDPQFEKICEVISVTRPTAVNLFWAIERMRQLYELHRARGVDEIKEALVREAQQIKESDVQANREIGRFGQELLPNDARVLTHCNAGALATAGYGTALGVIRAAVEAGKKVSVYADETRPFLQGARLTAWELAKDNIPVTVITDNMAGHIIRNENIDCVIVGADRIAANGGRGKQDRHLLDCGASQGERDSVLCRRTYLDARSEHGGREPDSHRRAGSDRGSSDSRYLDHAGDDRGSKSGLRCDAPYLCSGNHHRQGNRPAALLGNAVDPGRQ